MNKYSIHMPKVKIPLLRVIAKYCLYLFSPFRFAIVLFAIYIITSSLESDAVASSRVENGHFLIAVNDLLSAGDGEKKLEAISSSSNLISHLSKQYEKRTFQQIDTAFSQWSTKQCKELRKQYKGDFLITGATVSTSKNKKGSETNPWLVQDSDPLLNSDTYQASTTGNWQVIDIKTCSLIGSLHQSFHSSEGEAGMHSYDEIALLEFAFDKLYQNVAPTINSYLKRTDEIAVDGYKFEIIAENVKVEGASKIADKIEAISLIKPNSVELIEASGNILIFSCMVTSDNLIEITDQFHQKLAGEFNVQKASGSSITIEKRGPAVVRNKGGASISQKTTQQNSEQKALSTGRYHAVIIGINGYINLSPLKTAVNDARKVDELLRDEYGFTTDLLIDATRAQILDIFYNVRHELDTEDNLLIYYAGHGWLDKEANEGYWLPKNADLEKMDGWISNATITSQLLAIPAKHVIVVADSCYSGKLTRGIEFTQKKKTSDSDTAYFNELSSKKSRTVISSGGLEPVSDNGIKDNSIFAYAFLSVLRDNSGFMDGFTLFENIKSPLVYNSEQTPQYSVIKNAGHFGGDFVFNKKR